MKTLVVLCLLVATPLGAEDQPLAWAQHRDVANRVSDVLVAGQIGVDTWYSWQSEDRPRAFGCQALRLGLAIGIAESVKRLVKRSRPDASDRFSFPSEHTMIAAVSSSWRWQIGVAINVGYLRGAANRHFISDIGVGATTGFLLRKVCDGGS